MLIQRKNLGTHPADVFHTGRSSFQPLQGTGKTPRTSTHPLHIRLQIHQLTEHLEVTWSRDTEPVSTGHRSPGRAGPSGLFGNDPRSA